MATGLGNTTSAYGMSLARLSITHVYDTATSVVGSTQVQRWLTWAAKGLGVPNGTSAPVNSDPQRYRRRQE